MLSPKQQAFDLFDKSQKILIVLPESQSVDSVASALALSLLGQALGKKIDLVSQEPIPQKLEFLPGQENIKNNVSALRDFIISIDTTQKKIKQLRYETKDSILKIYLASPDKLEEKDIRLEPGPYDYDTIIVIDAPDFESLGQFYESHAELFFQRPVLNIDHKSGNEHFGEVNLVEPTASSSAEIVSELFNTYFPEQITSDIATCLLAGIMDETGSFKKTNTGPQTFSLASMLILRGAEKEIIVQHLYKTKPLTYLKLWGRLLSRLGWQAEKNLAWLIAYPQDFEETQSNRNDLIEISEEIHDLLPGLSASVILLEEETDITTALVQSSRIDLLQKLSLELGGTLKNHRAIFKIIDGDTSQAQAKLDALINSLL